MWAMAASPLIVDDKVIVLSGWSKRGKSVVAYNKNTGAPVWKAQNDRQAYVIADAGDAGRAERQILVVSASRVFGTCA